MIAMGRGTNNDARRSRLTAEELVENAAATGPEHLCLLKIPNRWKGIEISASAWNRKGFRLTTA